MAASKKYYIKAYGALVEVSEEVYLAYFPWAKALVVFKKFCHPAGLCGLNSAGKSLVSSEYSVT